MSQNFAANPGLLQAEDFSVIGMAGKRDIPRAIPNQRAGQQNAGCAHQAGQS
ncbi:MAG: hypothetical protein FWG10_11620 [Eubacteriaceae bacterium]|nr:hypothetical protein [Eubacteriaceae bacterium]